MTSVATPSYRWNMRPSQGCWVAGHGGEVGNRSGQGSVGSIHYLLLELWTIRSRNILF